MRLILLGAPGVGKGTQGALLAERHGLTRVATGDLLREAVRDDKSLGRKARRFMDAGELVPDELILDLVREVLGDSPGGFVLDGFPRTFQQAVGLDRILEDLGQSLDAVIVLEAPDDVIVRRISGRRPCPDCGAIYNVHFSPPAARGTCDRCGGTLQQRADDDEATVLNRLQVYRRETQPLIQHYRETGVPVQVLDGAQSVGQVQAAIHDALAPA